MNEEVYAAALKNALAEIKNVCPDVNQAYILMSSGKIVSANDQPIEPTVENAVNTLQDLAQKARSVGGLNDVVIDGEKGKVHVSQFDSDSMYSVMALSKRADLSFLRTVTGIVIPTIFKVLSNVGEETAFPTPLRSAPIVTPYTQFRPAPSEPLVEKQIVEETTQETIREREDVAEETETEPLQIAEPEVEEEQALDEGEMETEPSESMVNLPSQQLIVDKFGGLMVRADTVQLDSELLQRWRSMLDDKEIREVDIETFRGKTTRCKTKAISDQKFEGRGLIRIPEKTCDALELKRGELVRVKPVLPEEE